MVITIRVQIRDDYSGRDIDLDMEDIIHEPGLSGNIVDRYGKVRHKALEITEKVARAYKETLS